MPTSRKRNIVTRDMIEKGIEMLTSLPPVRKTKLEAVEEWLPHILEAKERGYSIEELSVKLNSIGFDTSPATLQSYLSKVSRKKSKPKEDTPSANKDE